LRFSPNPRTRHNWREVAHVSGASLNLGRLLLEREFGERAYGQVAIQVGSSGWLWRWFRHGFQLASATGSVNRCLILASCGWMLSVESELKGKLSSDNLLALVSGKPMSSDSIFLSNPRVRVLFKKRSPRYRVACAADTDSDVHCGSDVHLLRFVPAHCTGEHFAILGRHGVFGR